MTSGQRRSVRVLLQEGKHSTSEIAAQVGVGAASVRAVKAHLTLKMRPRTAKREQSPHPDLVSVPRTRKSGAERFHDNRGSIDAKLLDFWTWCNSDLLSNAVRGRLAEFLVAMALGVDKGVRQEWISVDLSMPNGITVEVKSASYVQTWQQRRDSPITFDVRPTLGWNPDIAEFGKVRKRQAAVYVFALFEHRDRPSVDPLNVAQWRFYVLATSVLDAKIRDQKSLSLRRLMRLKPAVVTFDGIAPAVNDAARQVRERSRG